MPAPGASRLPVETLLQTIRTEHPDVAPTRGHASVRRADAPVTVAVPQRTLYFDAYSGRLLGEGSQGVRRFMSETRAWHRWLAVEGEGRPVARFITGWSNVLFLFIVVSGFYLWFPRKWTWDHVRSVVLFNRKATGKARDFNWHNVIGVWSAIPLFIVVLTCIADLVPVGERVGVSNGRRRAAAAARSRRRDARDAGAREERAAAVARGTE